MNIEISATLFFSLFLLIPLLVISLLLVDSLRDKEKKIDLKLQKKVTELFDTFENKKLILSKEDKIEYEDLKKIKLKYNTYTRNIIIKAIIISVLTKVLLKNIFNGTKNSNSNKKLLKGNKELKKLREDFVYWIIVGVLVHNKGMFKFFLFVNSVSIESVEVDMFSNKNSYENYAWIKNNFSKISFPKLIRIA